MIAIFPGMNHTETLDSYLKALKSKIKYILTISKTWHQRNLDLNLFLWHFSWYESYRNLTLIFKNLNVED